MSPVGLVAIGLHNWVTLVFLCCYGSSGSYSMKDKTRFIGYSQILELAWMAYHDHPIARSFPLAVSDYLHLVSHKVGSRVLKGVYLLNCAFLSCML